LKANEFWLNNDGRVCLALSGLLGIDVWIVAPTIASGWYDFDVTQDGIIKGRVYKDENDELKFASKFTTVPVRWNRGSQLGWDGILNVINAERAGGIRFIQWEVTRLETNGEMKPPE